MEIIRPFWQKRIEETWAKRSIIWLMGIRRVGKTSLCQSLPNIVYFDCELPSVRNAMKDPEAFLDTHDGKTLVIDEIHRLENPSELLKIAADYHKSTKIIATGSSTLGASAKFQDTLTGRKAEIWLTPLLLDECTLFNISDITQRFLYGGLPGIYVAQKDLNLHFGEWIHSYWAKDIQALFNVEKKDAFQKFIELLFINSSGIFEASRYAALCEVNRATITHYLNVLEETFVIHKVRPFSTHKSTEITSAPKVYAFDTGFVNYFKNKSELRGEDLGFMWEHCVLNEIHAHLQSRTINYWRTKNGAEMDFVISNRSSTNITAIECKFSRLNEDVDLASIYKNFASFRQHYPNGANFVVSHNQGALYKRNYKDIQITFVNTTDLVYHLQQSME